MHARVFYLTCTAFQYHARTFYWLTTSRPRHAVFKLLLNAYMIMIFHLSFYFICSTIFNIEMSHFVESYVHCIQYIFHGILHTIYIPFVYCIHYYFLIKMYTIFFPYSLDKVHFICFTNFISNILIPLKSQVKTLKK